jgi:hypothetical protein
MILQERDKEVLKVVYQYRFLSSSQIKDMFFGCITRANIRLRILWENDLLERHYIRPLAFHGSDEAIYSLGRDGVDMVSDILGVDREIVARAKDRYKTLKPLFIQHLLGINDFSINLISLTEKHPELRMELWLNEQDAQDEYKTQGNGKTIYFRPDGYGRYWYKDILYSFFLEMDRSTEDNGKFEEKVKSYMEYERSGSYQRKFGVRFFRILVVTTTPKRVENLKGIADRYKCDSFWFTTMDNIRQGRMFQPVWMRACNNGLFSLLN